MLKNNLPGSCQQPWYEGSPHWGGIHRRVRGAARAARLSSATSSRLQGTQTASGLEQGLSPELPAASRARLTHPGCPRDVISVLGGGGGATF